MYFISLLTRQGYLIEEQGMTYLAETDSVLALAPLQSAACTYRSALGPRAGQKVLSLKTVPTQEPQVTAKRCVSEHGFSLHANIAFNGNKHLHIGFFLCFDLWVKGSASRGTVDL